MTNLKVRKRDILLTEDYFIPEIGNVDLTKLLSEGLSLSREHDIAIQDHFTTSFLNHSQSWVIIQYQINILEEAYLGDSVTIDTRIIDANRFFISRRYGISRNNILLYEIFAKFAVIDIDNRRIVRLKLNNLDSPEIVDESYKIDFDRLNIPSNEFKKIEKPIEILPEYIDRNQHVNNLVYLRWAYQSLPLSVFDNYKVSRINVKYEKEILPDDSITTHVYDMIEENKSTHHVIFNKTQNKKSSIIDFNWVEKNN